MARHLTSIEWVVAVAERIGGRARAWNPVVGCSHASAGCLHCYAERLAGTRLIATPRYAGLTHRSKAGPRWTGETRVIESEIGAPGSWRGPQAVFVCDMGDLFHETVRLPTLRAIFESMRMRPDCVFIVLTKRPDRMALAVAALMDRALPNVWLGATVEDQQAFNGRWPALRRLTRKGWTTWLSIEPLIGPLDIGPAITDGVAWVVVGGESGPGARPMHPDWVRSIWRQCLMHADLGHIVPFFFKQWGEWVPFGNPDHERLIAAETLFLSDKGRIERGGCVAASAHEIWQQMDRLGKKAAGRSFDGVHWDGVPHAAIRRRAA